MPGNADYQVVAHSRIDEEAWPADHRAAYRQKNLSVPLRLCPIFSVAQVNTSAQSQCPAQAVAWLLHR